MYAGRLRSALIGSSIAATLVACGSSGSKTAASSPSAPGSFASPVTVIVRFATDRSTALIVGEQVLLSATATLSTGGTEDCTVTSQWTSSNPNVMAVSSTGAVRAISAGAATISAVCRGVGHTLPLSVRPGLRITGLETRPFILVGDQQLVLRADVLDASGAVVRDCAQPAWTVSDTSVLDLFANSSGSGTRVFPHKEGDVTVTATCGDNAAITTMRVGHFTVFGTVRSASGEPIEGVSAFAGTTDAAGNYTAIVSRSPVQIFFAKPGFEGTTAEELWNRQSTMRVDRVLTPLANILLTRSGEICRIGPSCANNTTIPFTVPRVGRVEVRGYYRGDGYEDRLGLGVTCNGVNVDPGPSYLLPNGSSPFTFTSNPACQYVLYLANNTHENLLGYTVTLNIK